MPDQSTKDAEAPPAAAPFATPSLEDMQHWTWVMGRAQQLMMEHLAQQMGAAAAAAPDPAKVAAARPGMALFGDPAKFMRMQTELWSEGLAIWQRALGGSPEPSALAERADKDRRFAAPEWRDNPLYDTLRQTYLLVSERMLGAVEAIEGVDEEMRGKIRFATRRSEERRVGKEGRSRWSPYH